MLIRLKDSKIENFRKLWVSQKCQFCRKEILETDNYHLVDSYWLSEDLNPLMKSFLNKIHGMHRFYYAHKSCHNNCFETKSYQTWDDIFKELLKINGISIKEITEFIKK